MNQLPPYAHFLAEHEAQRASEAGMSIEEYRAKVDDELARADADRERARLREARERRLAPMKPRLTTDGFSAIVHGRESKTLALRFVRGWLQDPEASPMMVLTGGTGCGKTMAAAWALARAPSGQYAHARQLGAQFQPYTHDVARGITPLNLSSALLVVDDMGSEPGGEALRDQRFTLAFAEVLEQRQHTDRKTIITTNLTEDDFKARYCLDPRDLSRMGAMAVFAKCGQLDLRVKGCA